MGRTEGVGTAGPYGEGEPSGGIEYRFADLERDAGAIANLFNQPHAIEHLSGIAPAITPPGINVRKYGEKNPRLNILVATEGEIRQFYSQRDNLVPIVAVNESGKVVGTITVDKPSGPGLTYGGVSRLVVDQNERGKKLGRGLVRAAVAHALFRLRCEGVQAGIIIGVSGYELPLKIFLSEGFTVRHQAYGNCVSWSNYQNKFVQRDTHLVSLSVDQAKPRKTELMRYLPKVA